MTAQPLVQFRAVTLNPAPDGSVIRLQTALGEQLLDIAQRERVAQIPAHGAQNQLGLRLPPLKDLRSGCVIHGRCRLPADGCIIALAENEAHGDTLQPTTLEDWDQTTLPWIALWLKELIVWGTLDPV